MHVVEFAKLSLFAIEARNVFRLEVLLYSSCMNTCVCGRMHVYAVHIILYDKLIHRCMDRPIECIIV